MCSEIDFGAVWANRLNNVFVIFSEHGVKNYIVYRNTFECLNTLRIFK